MPGRFSPIWAGGQPTGTLGRCLTAASSTPLLHLPAPSTERRLPVANIKSQIKRNRTNEKARLRNKAVKSSLKTSVRKFREAAAAGDATVASAAAREASKALDTAVSKGVIHTNQAANRKSAIDKKVSAL